MSRKPLTLIAALLATSTLSPAMARADNRGSRPGDTVRLPKDAYRMGGSRIIVPTFHEYNAPHRFTVDGRTYYREPFNRTQSGGRVFMSYAETPDSIMSRTLQREATQRAQDRRNSW
jgi:hypothetical protein